MDTLFVVKENTRIYSVLKTNLNIQTLITFKELSVTSVIQVYLTDVHRVDIILYQELRGCYDQALRRKVFGSLRRADILLYRNLYSERNIERYIN